MAKKKVSKEGEKKGFQYGKELQGLALILIGLLGFGNFGIVGDLVKKFSIFLFGNWYVLLLMISLVFGIFLVAKRKEPNLLSARLIGIYTIVIALLLFSHINYLKDTDIKGTEIFSTTIDRIMAACDNFTEIRNTGGGLLGALFSWAFVSLFAIEGTNIVVIVLAGFGLIMLFDVTVSDVFGFISKPFKKIFKKSEKEQVDAEALVSTVEDIKDNVIISTAIDADARPFNNGELNQSYEQTKQEYILPPSTLLDENKRKGIASVSPEIVKQNTNILEQTLKDFGIIGKTTHIQVGPTVTQYEIEPERGTKLSKVQSLNKEIAIALAAKDVYILAPIPGKNAIGIQIPNPTPASVGMREIIEGVPRKLNDSKLLAPLGRDIIGNIQYCEIDKTPHMLIAGSTGSGKSVCINNIITSILMRATPDEVKLVLVDPKKVELNVYEGIPHLLTPVVTDPMKANIALQRIVAEMDRRYLAFRDCQTKNIATYNEYVDKKVKRDPDCGLERMPFILVVIDELADLMLVAAKDVEKSIIRITQLARAAGIHLIVATQRPSTDVITGLIKANIPTRLAFKVASNIDSRTILDMSGAEKLIGKGDMLYLPMGDIVPTRIQGSYISDDEIKRVVDFIKKRGLTPNYDEKLINLDKEEMTSTGFEVKDDDPLYNEIVKYASSTGKISASLIQRRFQVGYNRAARIMDILEERGIVGAANGSKPREVLISDNTRED